MTTSTSGAAAGLENEVLISSDQESNSSIEEGALGYLSDRPPSDEESFIDDDEEEEGDSDDDDDDDDDDDFADAASDRSLTNSGRGASGTGELPPGNDEQELRPSGSGKLPAKRARVLHGNQSKGKLLNKSKRKKMSERRNIRTILKGTQLDANTLAAQQDELERKRRLQERHDGLLDTVRGLGKEGSISLALKGLLEEAEKQAAIVDSHVPFKSKVPANDIVEVIDSDEDECVIVHETEKVYEDHDPENSGSHVNDNLNVRDHTGRVLVNVNHPQGDPDIYLSSHLGKAVKPHQIGGIRFLYDNVIESISRFNNSAGFGCILAHSMGLGKTIQVIGFVDVFLRHTQATRVLIIVPINTLQNWVAEFEMWLPAAPQGAEESVDISALKTRDEGSRKFNLNVLNDVHKNVSARAAVLDKWTKEGGVLLMGYEMYRMLSTRFARPVRRRKNIASEVIDLEEEDKNKEIQLDIQKALVDPGPDLVICDEGHRIKNSKAGISQTLKNMKTKRRVVLTGYPLQNNLKEYWCMVDFVRPNFLGTKVEFSNMFDRPITNGQCADSTPEDVRLMRHRAHVLHSLLEGFVQRRNHKVLWSALPEKEEWVLMIRLSPVQRILYKEFMDDLRVGVANFNGFYMNPLKAFAVCCKIWNHPDVLFKFLQSKKRDDDLDLDLARSEASRPPAANGVSKSRLRKCASAADVAESGAQNGEVFGLPSDKKEHEISYEWAFPLLTNYLSNILENSGKMMILFNILDRTVEAGEKLLVFSQSLFTLNLLEDYLTCRPLPQSPFRDKTSAGRTEFWARNKTFFRLDGSTPGLEREKLITQFNEPESRVSLFLLSTRAGCLGINLTGANRVVIMDASWNPCHDCQAVCRVYRYGQKRRCFIYRLVADNTLEKKIYERQITKQGMSDRVVDELQPQNRFGKKESDQLLEYEDKDLPHIDTSNVEHCCDDHVLVDTLRKYGEWVSQDPFKHESLLIDKHEYRLSTAEKRYAKESYEKEKRLNVSFSRPSYANYYQHMSNPMHVQPSTSTGHFPSNFSLPRSLPSHSFGYGDRSGSFPALTAGAAMPPAMPTPVPRSSLFYRGPGSGDASSGQGLAGPVTVRPGVSLQQMTVSRDITIGGSDGEARRIRTGEQVTLIRTSKGMYLRTPDSKIFAVRSHRNGGGAAADSLHQMLQEQQQMQQSYGSLHWSARDPVASSSASQTSMSVPATVSQLDFHDRNSAAPSGGTSGQEAASIASAMTEYHSGLDESGISSGQLLQDQARFLPQGSSRANEYGNGYYFRPDGNQLHNSSYAGGPSNALFQSRLMTRHRGVNGDPSVAVGNDGSSRMAWIPTDPASQHHSYAHGSASFVPHSQGNYYPAASSSATAPGSSSHLSSPSFQAMYGAQQPYSSAFSGYASAAPGVAPHSGSNYSFAPYGSSAVPPIACDSDVGDDDDVAVVSVTQPSSC